MKRLQELHVGELSIVDRGANKKKRFPIFKQEKTKMPNEKWDVILKAVLETELEGEDAIEELVTKMGISEKGGNAAKAVARLVSGFKDEMPADFMKALGEMVGIEPTVVEKKAAEKKKEDEEDEDEEDEAMKRKKTEGLSEDVKKHFQGIQKAADDKITALTERNEKVEKQLQVETDARQLAAWTEKARADLSHFPGKSIDEMGVMLKSLADLDPKMADTQFDTMKAASDALKESEILKNAGGVRVHEVTGSAWDKIEKLADGLIEKSEDLSMSREIAIATVMESPLGADLYAQYNKEAKAAG